MESLVIATLLLCSCASKKNGNVAYVEAHGYFVRNDVTDIVPSYYTSQAEFDSVFGCAAMMGKDGMPTKIDFNKSNVIAVVGKETSRPTEYSPVSLKLRNDTIYLRYSIKKDISTSYIMVPSMLLIIDKPTKVPVIKLEEINTLSLEKR